MAEGRLIDRYTGEQRGREVNKLMKSCTVPINNLYYNVCPRVLDPIYILTNFIKWDFLNRQYNILLTCTARPIIIISRRAGTTLPLCSPFSMLGRNNTRTNKNLESEILFKLPGGKQATYSFRPPPPRAKTLCTRLCVYCGYQTVRV